MLALTADFSELYQALNPTYRISWYVPPPHFKKVLLNL